MRDGVGDSENWLQPRKEAKEIPRMVVEQSPRTIGTQSWRVSSPVVQALEGGLQEGGAVFP